MAKSTKTPAPKGKGPPDPRDSKAFRNWLEKQPRQWSVAIASRAALRALPLLQGTNDVAAIVLPVFRAAFIARFDVKYPGRAIDAAAVRAAINAVAVPAPVAASYAPTPAGSTTDAYATYAAVVHTAARASRNAARVVSAARAAVAVVSATTTVAAAAAATTATTAATAAADVAADADAIVAAIKHDAQQLADGVATPQQLGAAQLWVGRSPPGIRGAWQELAQDLRAIGHHWPVWIDWYDYVVTGAPYATSSEAEDAAYTDIPGELPWSVGAEAVNAEIARRLTEFRASRIPDQSPAPVRVEERGGKVAKASDRDSPLSASERDFKAWRDPVVGHIEELAASGFAPGTNHSRVRDRLMALGKLLPGEIAEVKERQFRVGYEIERFEGLMAAYRSGDEDMPMLNAAQLEDLDRLRVALRMGIDKLDRWSEFRKEANESTAGEGDADREAVGDALDNMSTVMDQHPKYFDPELPKSFRFLAEAVHDPSGATKTVVYGAVKSAENVISFLGQRALGIGKKGVEAVETHISKAVATSLVAALGGAALELSGALPHGLAWLKPLLVALGVVG
jgi:hypothetical protein